MSTFGPQIAENLVFAPQILGGTYEHPAYGRNQFQNIPRRVAKFREVWFRDVEKSMTGKKEITRVK